MKKSVFSILTILLVIFLYSGSLAQSEAPVSAQDNTVQQNKSEPQYSTPPKEKTPFIKRIYLGGYFGLQFGTYTVIDVSPLVGIRVTPDFNIGIGLLYTYYKYDYYGVNREFNSWGGRLTMNYTLFNMLTLGAEYQYRTVETYNVNDNTFGSTGVNVLFLGGGLRQQVGRNTYMFLMAYYDVLQEAYSPYDNVVFRVGVSAGF